jgi:SAM-dependent methyltransferase
LRPDPEKVRVWDERAAAYDRLCHRWEIFSLLSNRLIDLMPADLRGPVLDVGSGTGLTTELLLARHPRCQPILIEPSEAMMNLARRNLAGRDVQFLTMGLDGARVRNLRAAAALASASMQFVDLTPAFTTLADIVAPSGHVAFNLWWHHWEETADRRRMTDWQAIAELACLEFGLPPPETLVRPVSAAKSRAELMDASSHHGFRLLAEHRDEDSTSVGFGLDFDAMDANWPVRGLSQEIRQALLARMLELSPQANDTLVSTRFLFQRAEEA